MFLPEIWCRTQTGWWTYTIDSVYPFLKVYSIKASTLRLSSTPSTIVSHAPKLMPININRTNGELPLVQLSALACVEETKWVTVMLAIGFICLCGLSSYSAAWATCQMSKIAVCACAGYAGNVFPANCGLAIPTCNTTRAWRTCRDACGDR